MWISTLSSKHGSVTTDHQWIMQWEDAHKQISIVHKCIVC